MKVTGYEGLVEVVQKVESGKNSPFVKLIWLNSTFTDHQVLRGTVSYLSLPQKETRIVAIQFYHLPLLTTGTKFFNT